MRKILAITVLSLGFLFVGSASAATLVVRTTADANNNFCGGNCALREAVAVAVSGDTIEFASPLFDTPQAIHLTLGELSIPLNKTLSINGRGANLTYITADNLSRVISNQGNLTLNGLTIQDGKSTSAGGGIYNFTGQRLSINDCVIFGNSVSSTNGLGNAFGGGIYNLGIAEINRSTIFGNTTRVTNLGDSLGGGIYNSGTLTIESSTISGNSSNPNSGNNGRGGGIYQGGTNTTILNTTITNNSANDGGGLYKINVPLNYVNTIISGNSGGNFTGNLTVNTNINNYTDGDARLSPLANNGGSTPTHALLPDSPVINTGSDCVLTANSCGIAHSALTTDQRGAGFQRRKGGAVEIGAIESPSVVYNANNNGAGSLNATITDAAAGDTITFDPTFFSVPRTIIAGITINKNLNIVGPGANILTLDANNGFRALHIDAGATVVFNGVRIFRGRAFGTDAGGGILISVNSTLYANGMVIESCSAPDRTGGAIYNLGTINLTGSTISNNYARGGGGIFNDGTAYLINSTVSGNYASADKGAGIYNAAGRFSLILNSTITNNQAESFAGAGIWNENFEANSLKVRARNTIIAGNISGNGNPVDYVGGLTDLGNNLVNNSNPGLAPLGNYGGSTPTHALLPNSPALNAGSDCVLTANSCGIAHSAFTDDQRGTNAPRKIGAAVDIGAFEQNIAIDQTNLLNGIQNQVYNQTLTATRFTSLAENLRTSEKVDFFNANSSFAPLAFSIVSIAGQSMPPGLILTSNGTISGTPTQTGTYTFTVKATDTDAMAGAARFSITITATNTPPTISGASLSRQAGSPVSNSQIATVNDNETGANSVSVSVTSQNPSNGVTVSNIVNTNGNVTANIVADCSATNTTFTLTASDGTSTANGNLTVNVSANTAPTLQYSANAGVSSGISINISPTTASDNGSVTYSIVGVSPALLNAPTVDGNGTVSIVNAAPSGSYQITVRATDNCGLTTDASFSLLVTNTRIVTKTADSNDGVCDADCSLREAIATANNGDIIQFASPLFDSPQTILLTESLQSLVVNKSLTISGRGANLLTVSRPPNSSTQFRVFTLNAPNISISGMTVSGGDTLDGGGIKIDGGAVILRGLVIENNISHADGGGVYVNEGVTLTFDSGTVRGNAINSFGINDGNGGGILARPNTTLLITNSQIYGNVIHDARSANFSPLGGGGGVDSSGNLTLLNSLIFQNSAFVDFIFNETQRVTGGGLFFRNIGVLNMKNTVIADNFSGIYYVSEGFTIPDGAQDFDGILTNSGGNLVKDQNNSIGYVASDLPHGTLPMIELGNNGGNVQTYAPSAGSPLIDRGETCVGTANGCGFTHPAIVRDIRGAIRPFDGDNNGSVLFDIGAVEAGASPSANVPLVDFINRYGFDLVMPNSIVRFNVVFSQNVSGVDASDFALTTTGNLSGAIITNVSGTGNSYFVRVNVGSGTNGTVRLDLNDNDTIRNSSNIPLGGAGANNGNFTAGEFFTVTNAEIDVTSPQDAMQIVNGFYSGGAPPENEGIAKAIDNTTGKYLNFTKDGSGFIVTPQRGATVLSAIRFYTANDTPNRDPASFRLEGSNNGESWTFITEQLLDLPFERNSGGQPLTASGLFSQTVQLPTNITSTPYQSYRVTFPTLRNSDFVNSMQIGEVELIGRAFVAPTAANVSISGRLVAANGNGIRNAIVTLTDANGTTRTARSTAFGYFSFDEVEAGQTVIISVISKRFQFTPQVVSVSEDITELNFTAFEQN